MYCSIVCSIRKNILVKLMQKLTHPNVMLEVSKGLMLYSYCAFLRPLTIYLLCWSQASAPRSYNFFSFVSLFLKTSNEQVFSSFLVDKKGAKNTEKSRISNQGMFGSKCTRCFELAWILQNINIFRYTCCSQLIYIFHMKIKAYVLCF